MFGLISKATCSLPQIPFLSRADDVRGTVSSVIPEVPALPTTGDLSGAVRWAGERVLDGVDNHIKYGTTLTRGVTYCGAAASNLPIIGSSIRPFVPQRQSGDDRIEKKVDA